MEETQTTISENSGISLSLHPPSNANGVYIATGTSSAMNNATHGYANSSKPVTNSFSHASSTELTSDVQVASNNIALHALEKCKHDYHLIDVAKNYVVALRPWSFSASLVPLLLGTALAYKESNDVNIPVFFFTAIAILSVHGAGNLVNTYYDFMKGIDSKKSDDRTLVDQKLSPQEVASFGALLYGVGCVAVLLTCMMSKATVEHIALIFFGGLSGSFLYTGGIGLKYHAFGDIVILLSFGPVAVIFTYVCQTGLLKFSPFWYTIPVALITEAILHANNSRDIETDKAANVITVAIMLGPTASYILYCLLLFTPYIIVVILGVNMSKAFFLPFVSLSVAFRLEKEFRRGDLKLLPQRTAQLNVLFGISYIISCLLADKESLLGFD